VLLGGEILTALEQEPVHLSDDLRPRHSTQNHRCPAEKGPLPGPRWSMPNLQRLPGRFV